jgi:predicted O-methyltransferase YrrM
MKPALALMIALTLCGCKRPPEKPTSKPSTAPLTQAMPQRMDPVQLGRYTSAEKAALYRKPYLFTADWFTFHVPLWNEIFAPFRGKPGVRYLEVGTYEGRSALWMLDNILTHPTSRMTVVDIFPGESDERWRANLKLSGAERRVTTIKGRSAVELRKLPFSFYDIVYIDASHKADDTLSDAILCWELLKDGGMMLFDDYGFAAGWAPELRPATAIDAFITTYRSTLDVLHQHNQVLVRKRANPCRNAERQSLIGRYCFGWNDNLLYPAHDDGEAITLTDSEIVQVRELLKARPYGRTEFFLKTRLSNDLALRSLLERLGIDPNSTINAEARSVVDSRQ